jgi:dCMP deaminase
MSDRIGWDTLFMNIAKQVARRSTCLRLQTGSILVKDNRIVSIGYNGVISGHQHCKDYWAEQIGVCSQLEGKKLKIFSKTKEFADLHRQWSQENELHAECNCILFADRSKTQGSTLYTVWSPCIMCAKIIHTSGVEHVYYERVYRDTTGIAFLKRSGITIERIFPSLDEVDSDDESEEESKTPPRSAVYETPLIPPTAPPTPLSPHDEHKKSLSPMTVDKIFKREMTKKSNGRSLSFTYGASKEPIANLQYLKQKLRERKQKREIELLKNKNDINN